MAAYFLRFCYWNPAVFASKSVDASGVQISSFTSQKSIRPDYRKVVRMWHRGPSRPGLGGRQDCLGDCGLGWVRCRRHRGGLGPGWDGCQRCGGGIGLVWDGYWSCQAALGAAMPSWLGDVKQNSSETKPLSCEQLVGVRRFELLTSSVSGKRSPPELNARSRVRECAGNNITELPPRGKNYFLKSGDLRPYPPRCGANSTRKVAFVPPTNSTFA